MVDGGDLVLVPRGLVHEAVAATCRPDVAPAVAADLRRCLALRPARHARPAVAPAPFGLARLFRRT